jgi:nicotinamidase/pyrazinamidase
MTYALIVCGMQYDHLPGGVLATPNSDQILAPIVQLTRDAAVTIAEREWHPENHYTFSDNPRFEDHSWPPHCVQGTKGARLHSSLRRHADYVVSIGMNRNEEAYSTFAGKTLRPVLFTEEILGKFGVTTVVVTGIRYSVEVKHTALDANSLGFLTIVPRDTTVVGEDPRQGETMEALSRAGVLEPDHSRDIFNLIDDRNKHLRSS